VECPYLTVVLCPSLGGRAPASATRNAARVPESFGRLRPKQLGLSRAGGASETIFEPLCSPRELRP